MNDVADACLFREMIKIEKWHIGELSSVIWLFILFEHRI